MKLEQILSLYYISDHRYVKNLNIRKNGAAVAANDSISHQRAANPAHQRVEYAGTGLEDQREGGGWRGPQKEGAAHTAATGGCKR